MPSRGTHQEFDRFLSKRGVLLPDADYAEVHTFMDLGVESFGAAHRELDSYHREDGLRQWLNGKHNVIGQDLATDWLRAGLGHICLDEAASSLANDYSWPEVFDSAHRSMAQRKWTTVRFVRK